jgi:ERCC4-related helicase
MPQVRFEPRPYQSAIARTAAQGNTLIVLPTGLGKTNVFLLIACERLTQRPSGKIVLLGPTRPLIDQYERVFHELTDLTPESMCVLTGRVPPEKRQALFREKQLIFSTPQGFENDLLSGRISLEDVVLLGFDEAHRASGEYSYVWIAKQYEKQARYARIVALTASPGTDKTAISEVMEKLHIEHVEVRTSTDPDVKPYIQPVEISYEFVELPKNLSEIVTALKRAFTEKIRGIAGYLGEPIRDDLSRTELLKLQAQLQGKLAAGRDFRIGKALSLAAEAMKIQHGIELAESQGVYALVEYLRDIIERADGTASKATKNLALDSDFRRAYAKALTLAENDTLHPKMIKLIEIVEDTFRIEPAAKIIIFNSYRDNAKKLVETLEGIDGVRAQLFVGQMKKRGSGLSQKEQKAMLESFSTGAFNVLVSTSIGEEGLDIPKVDSVIFYEPVPSTIRGIQRRGRTGRNEKGRVLILVTKGTRDEAYLWSARSREKSMNKTLKEIGSSVRSTRNETTLTAYSEDIVIYADTRERANPVVKELIELGAKIELEQLDVGDFLLSSEVVVEFKSASDFVDSLIDGRLLSQAPVLKRDAGKPLFMVEGFESIYGQRNIHPNAIRGVLSSLAVDFQLTIIPTKNPKDSAAMLYAIARREQLKGRRPNRVHAEKDTKSLSRMQEYFVASLPGVSTTLARPILERFTTIRALANATSDELTSVERIGNKKAELIEKLFSEPYDPLS